MSLLQLSVPAEEIVDRRIRRALINAICERTPTGQVEVSRVRRSHDVSMKRLVAS